MKILCNMGLHRWLDIENEMFVWRDYNIIPGTDMKTQRQYSKQLCTRCGLYRWRRWFGVEDRIVSRSEPSGVDAYEAYK